MPKGREMPSPIKDNPGPGSYTHVDPPPNHVHVPDLGRTQGRPDPKLASNIEPSLGPGTYEASPEQPPKGFTFQQPRAKSPTGFTSNQPGGPG